MPRPFPKPDPQISDDDLARLRLIRSRRVGPDTFSRLMREHGTAAAALAALPEVARAAGLDDYTPCPEAVALAEARAAQALGATLLHVGRPPYPAALAEISGAPPLLWALGNPALLTRPMIAVAGARNASALGQRLTRRLVGELSEANFVVVSGLARGIDAAAHAASMQGGTVAVQAGGVDVVYPQENRALAEEIALRGLRLSEMPMGMPPRARHFPARNRIISGLARAVLVIEAAAKSGSLITARLAGEQGREVMAVPGHPFDARSSGANMLLRDGAVLVRHAGDVIEALGQMERQHTLPLAPAGEATPVPPEPDRPIRLPSPPAMELSDRILARLGAAPTPEDQLLEALGLPVEAVGPALAELELLGAVLRQPGGMLSRAEQGPP